MRPPAVPAQFDLIETLRFDPEDGLFELGRHLTRLGASADALDLCFDRHAAANELQAACFLCQEPARVRLRLSPTGALAIELSRLLTSPAVADVAIAALPVATDDPRLRHKTGDRAFYDDSRRASGAFEVLFVRPDGFLTEGSFTTLFVARDDGILATPPLDRGLLPGVLRARLLHEGRAVEADVRRDDLARPFFIGNALRGLVPARMSALPEAVAAGAKRRL